MLTARPYKRLLRIEDRLVRAHVAATMVWDSAPDSHGAAGASAIAYKRYRIPPAERDRIKSEMYHKGEIDATMTDEFDSAAARALTDMKVGYDYKTALLRCAHRTDQERKYRRGYHGGSRD
jgi:hypothetical protein